MVFTSARTRPKIGEGGLARFMPPGVTTPPPPTVESPTTSGAGGSLLNHGREPGRGELAGHRDPRVNRRITAQPRRGTRKGSVSDAADGRRGSVPVEPRLGTDRLAGSRPGARPMGGR